MSELCYEIYWPSVFAPPYLIGVVITAYNRPDYLEKCLLSLQASELSEAVIAIIDDGSDNQKTLALIKVFDPVCVPVLKIYRKSHDDIGIADNLRFAWNLLRQKAGCRFLCNLDGDAIVKPQWLNALLSLFQDHASSHYPIVTGFNAFRHKVKRRHEAFCEKQTIGGLNLFFDQETFDEFIMPSLQHGTGWDWFMVECAKSQQVGFLCTRPSVVQHIGKQGMWSNFLSGYDYAVDFRTQQGISLVLRTCVAFLGKHMRYFALLIKESLKFKQN